MNPNTPVSGEANMKRSIQILLIALLVQSAQAGDCKVNFTLWDSFDNEQVCLAHILLMDESNPDIRSNFWLNDSCQSHNLAPGSYLVKITSLHYQEYCDRIIVPDTSEVKISMTLKGLNPVSCTCFECTDERSMLSRADISEDFLPETDSSWNALLDPVIVLDQPLESYYSGDPFFYFYDTDRCYNMEIIECLKYTAGVNFFEENLFLNGYDDRLFVR